MFCALASDIVFIGPCAVKYNDVKIITMLKKIIQHTLIALEANPG
tara:strand:+ start:361 stop:495 length:135 start_codon:yes stop_codon:yes gene_type:complete